MKLKYILIICLMIFSACETQVKIENPNGIFSDSEIIELNGIISEFDAILTSEYETENVKIAYIDYSKQFREKISGLIPVPDGMTELGVKVMELEVFQKIWWQYDKSIGNTGVYNIGPKEYLKYLEYIGKKSKFINGYYNSLKDAQDIIPSIVGGFAMNIENIDLNNKNNRLIFVIHYLTLINR